MGLLKENQKKEVRYDGKIFKLYEPDDEQRESLSEIIIDNSITNKNFLRIFKCFIYI